MRGMHMRFAETGGIGGYQRQVAIIGELNQPLLRRIFHRVAGARQFDIEAAGEQGGELFRKRLGLRVLPFREQPRHRAFGRAGQCDQPLAMPVQIRQPDMGIEFQRPVEMRPARQMAQVLPAILVLRVKRQVIDMRALALTHDAEQHPHDRLHAGGGAGAGEGNRAV